MKFYITTGIIALLYLVTEGYQVDFHYGDKSLTCKPSEKMQESNADE